MVEASLRRYHPDDAADVWDLHVAAFADEGGYDEVFANREADLERVVEEYLGTNGEFLVAEAPDGDLVAMGGFQPDGEDDDVAVIRRMRVHPAHQREGLGSWLLDELETRAAAAGFELLTLDTSTEMQAAIQFYEARGFEQVDRAYVPETDSTLVFFEKELGEA